MARGGAAAARKRASGGRTRRQAVAGDAAAGPAVMAVADADEVFERGELWHRRGCPAMEHTPGQVYFMDESDVPEHWHREDPPEDSEHADRGLVQVPSRVDRFDAISPQHGRVDTVRCNDCGEQITITGED